MLKNSCLDLLATSKLILNNTYAYNNWLYIDYNALVNPAPKSEIVIGGLIGAIQINPITGEPDAYFTGIEEASNKYINSIYNPQFYTKTSDWYIINEYGTLANSLAIVYADSNKLQGEIIATYNYTSGDAIEYPEAYYNDANVLATGIKVYDLYI